jgi:hypothetical protein
MLPMEKSVTFTGACANEIIPSINRSFVYKAKEGGDFRISDIFFILFQNVGMVISMLKLKTHSGFHDLFLN